MPSFAPASFAKFYTQEPVNVIDGDSEKVAEDERLHRLFRVMVDEIKTLKQRGFQSVIAWSKGKDSTTVLLAELQAHSEWLAENPEIAPCDAPVVVTSIDTGVENVFVQIHALYEDARLQRYCKDKGITLELLTTRPPLAERWASLFLTAHKLPSVGRLNNDCSVILKINQSARLLKSINERFGADKVVTIVGSRHEESVSRSHSIRRNNNDVDIEEVMANGKPAKVFMPIRDWSYEDVMGLLSRAGTNPMTRPEASFSIPAYAENFRILRIIYGDADSGSCPVSAHKIQGANKQAGCGGSRFGCGLCLKVQKDKSAENQNKKARYKHLQHNLKRVRDFIYFVSQDLRHRTYHSRAVDYDTGHVVLQPNVLKASTIERIALYLMQLTDDDKKRAAEFRKLAAQGHQSLMLDAGYADIMSDPELSIEDREEFRSVYVQGAQRQLINIIGEEEALYLDAMHSRDGVRLPPYRMFALFCQVRDGFRLPYPSVNVDRARVDEIPDARMMPIQDLPLSPRFRQSEFLEQDARTGCLSSLQDSSETYTLKLRRDDKGTRWSLTHQGRAVPLHPLIDADLASDKAQMLHDLDNTGETEVRRNIALRHRRIYSLPAQVNLKGIDAEPYRHFTRRKAILKKGQLTKGRASVKFYGFREESRLSRAHLQRRPFWLPDWSSTEARIFNEIDNSRNDSEPSSSVGYRIDPSSLSDWLQFMAHDAIAMHDEYIAAYRSKKETRFQYQGVDVFESLLRTGLLAISKGTEASSRRISDRTSMFNQMGLFLLKDNHSITSAGISMAQYRHIKAVQLQQLRAKRSASRAIAVDHIKQASTAPSFYAQSALMQAVNVIVSHYGTIHHDWLGYQAGLEMKLSGFDDVNFSARSKVARVWLDKVDGMLGDFDALVGQLLTEHHRKALQDDWTIKLETLNFIKQVEQQLAITRRSNAVATKKQLFTCSAQVPYYLALSQWILTQPEEADEIAGWNMTKATDAIRRVSAFLQAQTQPASSKVDQKTSHVMPRALVGGNNKAAMAAALIRRRQMRDSKLRA
ncbi:hypothetical protein K0504_09960 [Neiella marina]|uniref:Phosphoadenosine phosphosulphate reductase domain-containing protein n=1 Tax=Neiella holothuriorum TaxID=2870530 RepID=A0ABS7EI92_9GAMM|nr:hypothetical protein [Neiella holothuriorum]MBW8191362.1 hypothetical protein [Neiella holothuriorum]